MPRSPSSESSRLPIGAAAAAAAVVAAVAAAWTVGACATQEVTPAPDAGTPPCETGPAIFCQPAAADQPGCNTDEGASRLLTRLPRATRYPVDCVINFVGER